MNVFKPNYYDRFECIADKCKHNCCIGWEIDIDDESMRKYKKAEGVTAKKLNECILSDPCPHFVLTKDERCPFLDDRNLCEIITNMGEDFLCQICADHPRFVNCSDTREEIGIGMCCEEAARIIVTNKEKVEIVGAKADEDDAVYNMRDKIISSLQDRTKSIDERIEEVLEFADIEMPKLNLKEEFSKLERLDEKWSDRLEKLDCELKERRKNWDTEFEQIAVYFVYRHFAEGMFDMMFKGRLLFAFLSLEVIREIFERSEEDEEELIDICRMYSAEVEYSEENTRMLIEKLNG